MASSSKNQFKAGLFIVISFAVAAVIFFGITGSALLDGPHKTYHVIFDLSEDVGGLAVGSEVRVGGAIIGKVDKIDIVTINPGGQSVVQVSFSIPAPFPIKRDAVVTVQSPLTGEPDLNITSLGTGQLATDVDQLDGQTSGFARAIDTVGVVGDKAQAMIDDLHPRINALLDDVKPRANATLDQIKSTAATAEQTIALAKSKIDPAYEKYAAVADGANLAMSTLNEILGGGKGDLKKTIADLSGAMASVHEKLPGILDRATGVLDSIHTSLDKTAGVLDDLKATAANTKDFTGSAKSVLATNRTRIDDIVRSVKMMAENFGAASGEIRRSPWRLLYQPKENEVANQNLYDATRQFAEASRKLQDSAVALRDLMNDPNADKSQAQAMIDALNHDFAEYQKIEGALWDRVRK